MRRSSMLVWAVCFLVAGGLCGCKLKKDVSEAGGEGKKSAAVAGQSTEEKGPESLEPVGGEDEKVFRSFLLDSGALVHLPTDVALVVAVENPMDLLKKAGFAELTQKFGDLYEKGVAEVARATGHNLLSPEGLSKVGLDLLGTAGFAILSIDRESFVWFGMMKDPDAAKTALYDISGRVGVVLSPRRAGDCLIVAEARNDDTGFLLCGNVLYFVFSDHADTLPHTGELIRLSSVAPETSLATEPAFVKTMSRLTGGDDAALYVSVQSLLTSALADQQRVFERYTLSELERRDKELAEAVESQASELEISSLKRRYEDQKKYADKRRLEMEREGAVSKLALGGLGPVAVGADIGDDGVVARGVVAFGQDPVWTGVLETGEMSHWWKALAQRPLVMMDGKVSLAKAFSLVKLIVEALGEDWGSLASVTAGILGVPFALETLSFLEGTAGWAMTFELPVDDSRDASSETLGGAVVLKLADPEKGVGAVTKLLSMPLLSGMVTGAPDEGWQIAVHEWRTVFLDVVGEWLVLSTDKEFAGRLASGEPGAWWKERGESALGKEVLEGEVSARWLFDFGATSLLMMSSRGDYSYLTKSPEPSGNAPKSEEYKGVEKELKAVGVEMESMERRRFAKFLKRSLEFSDSFGLTLGEGTLVEDGIVLSGRHIFGAKTLEGWISQLIQRGMAFDEMDRDGWAEQQKLWDKSSQLRQRLLEIRQRDQLEYDNREQQAPEAVQPAVD